MANRKPTLSQAKAKGFLTAAREAGFECARIVSYPDGRFELIGGPSLEPSADDLASPFEQWKAKNAGKN